MTDDATSVRVIHGANEGRFPCVGETVREIARSLRDTFNIPEDAIALVNGSEVSGSYVVNNGESIEFVRRAGFKGGLHDYWSEREVVDLLGANAVHEMAERQIHPVSETVFTSQQVSDYLGRLRQGKESQGSLSSLVVDFASMKMTYGDQGPLEIDGSIVFKLLNRLSVRPSHYVYLDTLKRDVWNDQLVDDETVQRTARRLRQKLQKMQLQGVEVKTQNGGWALFLSDSSS